MAYDVNENEINLSLANRLSNLGMMTRGAFHPKAGAARLEGVATVVLVGNAGSGMWDAFTRDVPIEQRQKEANPLDNWTRKVILEIADGLADGMRCQALFPFEGPPYYPFQRWAMEAENLSQSPIGPLIHYKYGLWHAYRAALVFDTVLDVQNPEEIADICAACDDKPCLSACPVNAFSFGQESYGYDVPACAAHLNSIDGSDCMERGCRARRICPIGQDYIYDSEHAYFHMEKFRLSHS